MAIRNRTSRMLVTFVTVCTVLFFSSAAPVSTAPLPKVVPLVDGGWPKSFVTSSGASVILYQPQIASWANQQTMTMYAAVAYTPAGASTPVYGTLKAEARTKVSVGERLVDFSMFQITDSNFPTLGKDQVQGIVAEVTKAIPPGERVIALDRVIASIDSSQIEPKNDNALGLSADAPPIFFSSSSAVLVNLDGAPIWNPVKDTDLQYAVNTNWDLFRVGSTNTVYLRNDTLWLKADTLDGSWRPAGALPPSFSQLPANENWAETRAHIPGATIAAAKVPKVFVSQKPAELILLRGVPTYQPVMGTNLNWVSNTDSDVFRMGTSGSVYYLVAGRWFSAPDFQGPWTFATPTLPEAFRMIPIDNPRSRVLASVPGTPQAAEAVLLASIPQTARVSKTLAAPAVAYQGDPDFQPILSTSVSRAVNTAMDVFFVNNAYYLCYQGVWFTASTPNGPWSVTASIPNAIYSIPSTSPSYNVTFVTATNDDDDDWVDFSAWPAYTGMMVGWGTAMWGTGYYYPPYVGWAGGFPAYFPYYPSYGYGAWYNPWTSSYGRAAAMYGPYGGAGIGARYNPVTGTYARGAAAWGPYGGAAAGRAYNPRTGTVARGGVVAGPYGARGAAEAYNPRTGASGATRQGSGIYGNWGTSSVQRGDDWARTAHTSNNVTGATTRAAQGSGGGAAVRHNGAVGTSGVAKGPGGDVYAGHDGNVYRNDGGGWQKFDSGGWSGVNRPGQPALPGLSPTPHNFGLNTVDPALNDQLNHDSFARMDGAQRANDWSGVRAGGGWGGDSLRPAGGGFDRGGVGVGGGGFRGGGFGGGGFGGGRGGGRR